MVLITPSSTNLISFFIFLHVNIWYAGLRFHLFVQKALYGSFAEQEKLEPNFRIVLAWQIPRLRKGHCSWFFVSVICIANISIVIRKIPHYPLKRCPGPRESGTFVFLSMINSILGGNFILKFKLVDLLVKSKSNLNFNL